MALKSSFCLAWTIVSLYNIAGADAREDFSFVDENSDNSMTWGEVSQEAYDIDPDDNDSFSQEIEENSDSFRVKHAFNLINDAIIFEVMNKMTG